MGRVRARSAKTPSASPSICPAGLSTDSATRSVVLPPFGGRNLFFRVRGRWPVGGFRLGARVTPSAVRAPRPATSTHCARSYHRTNGTVFDGLVAFEYPHIPTQWFPVLAADNASSRWIYCLPASLRVAFIRANRNDRARRAPVGDGDRRHSNRPLALAVVDLSIYNAIIAPRAYR